jgi:hypothetical protein
MPCGKERGWYELKLSFRCRGQQAGEGHMAQEGLSNGGELEQIEQGRQYQLLNVCMIVSASKHL